MTIAERISETVRHLPPASQQEVLDFVEFLAEKSEVDQVSSNGETSAYQEKLALMQGSASDPMFLADLDEIREDFRYVDADEVIG